MPINPLFVALMLAQSSGGTAAAGAPPPPGAPRIPRRIGRGLRQGRATRKPGRFAGPDDPMRVRCRKCKAEPGANCDRRTLGRHAFHRVRVEDALRDDTPAGERP